MSKLPLFRLLMHRITFVENSTSSELEKEEWKSKYETFASITPLFDNKVSSLEKFDFGHIVTEGYFLFKIRALLGVNNKMRILFNDRFFEIKRIIDVNEQGKIQKIVALELL